jgi:Fuc2NAc and GlcNAc transferase
MEYLVGVILSFLLGLSGAVTVIKFGSRWQLLDIPGQRSSHTVPTPKGGGIGIPIAALATAFFFAPDSLILTGFASAIAAVAFLNDRMELPVSVRFLVDLILAAAFVLITHPSILSSLPIVGHPILFVISLVGGAFYLVAATNFFNFMDGINGIAGLEAIISFALMGFYIAALGHSTQFSLFCLAIVAASAGFLLLNFPRAKVFMGDVGSTFLGFTYAALVLSIASNFKDVLLLTLFQGVFYIDCIITLILRLFQNENIFQAHRKHLYQKLVHSRKWTHTKVTLIFGFVQTVLGIVGLLIYNQNIAAMIFLWLMAVILYWAIMAANRLTKT